MTDWLIIDGRVIVVFILFFLVLFCRLYCIPVDNLCCTTFVFDSYDDAHGDDRGFDGQKLVR